MPLTKFTQWGTNQNFNDLQIDGVPIVFLIASPLVANILYFVSDQGFVIDFLLKGGEFKSIVPRVKSEKTVIIKLIIS